MQINSFSYYCSYVFFYLPQGNLDQLIVQEEDLESEDTPFPPPYPLGTECSCTCQVCYSVVKLHLRVCCQMAVCDECLQQYFSHSVSEGIGRSIACFSTLSISL